jgi:hypothetical protein
MIDCESILLVSLNDDTEFIDTAVRGYIVAAFVAFLYIERPNNPRIQN